MNKMKYIKISRAYNQSGWLYWMFEFCARMGEVQEQIEIKIRDAKRER